MQLAGVQRHHSEHDGSGGTLPQKPMGQYRIDQKSAFSSAQKGGGSAARMPVYISMTWMSVSYIFGGQSRILYIENTIRI